MDVLPDQMVFWKKNPNSGRAKHAAILSADKTILPKSGTN
jgi:hypothetical protein